ncbi:MAG: endopeptidase La [Peptococcaceae bacterium]|nr:endopeptidase La [Peptococcaceae bacterium]
MKEVSENPLISENQSETPDMVIEKSGARPEDFFSSSDYFEMPLLPLRGLIVFPYMMIHLDVGRERSINAVDDAMLSAGQLIFLSMQLDPQVDNPGQEDIATMGTVAKIKQLVKLPGGTVRVLVEGLYRAKIEQFIFDEPYMLVSLSRPSEEPSCSFVELEALSRNLERCFNQYAKDNKKITPDALTTLATIEDPRRLGDIIATYLRLKLPEKQKILDTAAVDKRLEMLIGIVNREIEIIDLDKRISQRVREQMDKSQKEYYLREQMKAIQKELGEGDERTAEVAALKAKAAKIKFPAAVKEKLDNELDRLQKMPPLMAEAMVVRNYIDWILDLPWDKTSKDKLDLADCEAVLDREHYGLEKVKERVLEYLAVSKLTHGQKSPILCLVGPPGVGKTSLAQSIAKSLNRKFIRISLGGVRDEAEIRGHRRTYIGALPGRIIQNMKTAGVKNPLFLLDEIDKMSTDFRGDPASALLEVLDPEQNNSFSDHYLEVPFDLSQVMFITTANVKDNIPRPLLDRMEVIDLPSYTQEEKTEIAKRHLIPKNLTQHGLEAENVQFSDNAIRMMIRCYTREAGVRNLERTIAKVCRKLGRAVVSGETGPFKITAQTIGGYLGAPKFPYAAEEKTDQVGVATGLAWTQVGGEVLEIEVQVLPGKGKISLTGQLGDVMKESVQTGYTYIRAIGEKLGIASDVEEKYDIHLHVPEGAIPKDGPSAGITMALAIASALTERPIRHEVAMTGEITLRGRVLPVGGIKEKVLAAYRHGAKVIILPAANKKDLEDIPLSVLRKLKFHFVEQMEEVIEIALLPKKK